MFVSISYLTVWGVEPFVPLLTSFLSLLFLFFHITKLVRVLLEKKPRVPLKSISAKEEQP